MPSIRPRIIVGLLTILVAVGSSIAGSSGDPAEAVSLLAKGKRLLREGNWYHAAKTFEELAGRYPNSENLDQFVFYRAKAKYYSGEFSEAIAGFTYFLSRFGDSQEAAYAHFFLANAYYRHGDISLAARNYLEAYRLTDDEQLTDMAAASLAAAFKKASSISIGKADFAALPIKKRCSLSRVLADILADRGQAAAAEELRFSCGGSTDRADILQGRSSNRKNELEIAMVLPFSGELHFFGEDIYDGAAVAAELYRSKETGNLKLAPYDTKGDPINAARIIGEVSESEASAAIGPLSSEATSVVSARLSCESLPLLIPAATQAGLTRLSGTSFQLSPNIELQGVKMAEYAVDNLQANSAAVITSTSTEHLQMAKAFSQRFQQLGGTVVAEEHYRSRDKDFGPYIKDIKAILLGKHPDSIFFVNEDGDTLDPDGIPAHVDCLFLPGNPRQIRLLLPQITFYNLNGSYLGSDGWGDETVLKLGDDITKGAVFPSPFLRGASSEEYVRFAAAYDARFGHRPNRLSALGYDAVQLLIAATSSGTWSRKMLSEELKKVRDYHGASGEITFGVNRENIEMPLFHILSEEAVPLLPSTDLTGYKEDQ